MDEPTRARAPLADVEATVALDALALGAPDSALAAFLLTARRSSCPAEITPGNTRDEQPAGLLDSMSGEQRATLRRLLEEAIREREAAEGHAEPPHDHEIVPAAALPITSGPAISKGNRW